MPNCPVRATADPCTHGSQTLYLCQELVPPSLTEPHPTFPEKYRFAHFCSAPQTARPQPEQPVVLRSGGGHCHLNPQNVFCPRKGNTGVCAPKASHCRVVCQSLLRRIRQERGSRQNEIGPQLPAAAMVIQQHHQEQGNRHLPHRSLTCTCVAGRQLGAKYLQRSP